MTTARPVADQRILAGVDATIRTSFADQDGTATTPGGAVTVDLTRADGTSIATGRTATGTSALSATLTAAEAAQLDLITCVWKDAGATRATTRVEVVGGFYFSLAELRAFDDSLVDTNKYPDAKILTVRREVEEECERITRVAFVPRFRRAVIEGPSCTWGPPAPVGTFSVMLPDPRPRQIRSVAVTTPSGTTTMGSTIRSSALLASSGLVTFRNDGSLPLATAESVTVEYEHGYDRPPADVRHAVLTRTRIRLNAEVTGVNAYATSFTQQGGGTWTLAQPGRAGFETGIPEVDAIYGRYSARIPGIA